jgi:sulfoxide reductase heme-binding subunit YedZ
VDALVPFGSAYSPVWTGVGAISADLMLAVLVTTALRRRLGYSTWRSVHMLAYGCWGAAVVHSVAIGTDARLAWAAVILAGCVGAFAGAVSLRFGGRPGAQRA